MQHKALNWIKKYHRATNYLSVAMLYLKDNFCLEEELQTEHIKNRVLGHFGTVPGINLIYACLNYYASEYKRESMLVVGPGHGAPAVLSNLYIEGSLKSIYPKISDDYNGLSELIKGFSWPNKFPSHTYPGLPGTIHEGGELGYSLGIATGAVLDNPDLTVGCIIGDGEAETGALSASWHGNKYINPKISGKVIPILHLNGYRISGPTIYGTMSNIELTNYFSGLGYEPIIVDQYKSKDIYLDSLLAFDDINSKINKLCNCYKDGETPKWPMLILRTKKGWTAPVSVNGIKIEDHNNSHGIPLKNCKTNNIEFEALKIWLGSYKFNELLNSEFKFIDEILEYVPKGKYRIGFNKHTFGWEQKKDLILPNLNKFFTDIDAEKEILKSSMEVIADYFSEVFTLNKKNKNFRLFSPDETESNKLGSIYNSTERNYLWPTRDCDGNYSDEGRLMEILSENTLQSWYEGYVKTGRHGVLISYEAFLGIITTQIDQYIKYIKQSKRQRWRGEIASLNYIATSTGWGQDHNGFTHQNPTLINTLLTKYYENVSIYMPSDANTFLLSMEDCLKRNNAVNLLVVGKHKAPQWLNKSEAIEHVKRGISIWDSVSNFGQDGDVDIVLASAGDYQTYETIAGGQILKELIPELKFQYVNVNEITQIGLGDEHNPVKTKYDFEKYFTKNKPIIFNFHGYPQAIKMITWNSVISNRLTILGYIEEGSTTTPFDMQVQNKTSRFHVAINAIKQASKHNQIVKNNEIRLIDILQNKLNQHSSYIIKNGEDMPEILNFKFR